MDISVLAPQKRSSSKHMQMTVLKWQLYVIVWQLIIHRLNDWNWRAAFEFTVIYMGA